MSNWSYSEDELKRYFNDRQSRRASEGPGGDGAGVPPPRPTKGWRGWFYQRIDDPRKAQAAFVVSVLGAFVGGAMLLLLLFIGVLSFNLPPLQAIENPSLSLSTVAYTADGRELARYHVTQNRTWVPFDSISTNVTDALVATEDHRFYEHWGVDIQGIAGAAFGVFRGDGLRGASTITQQLARNLYSDIGFERSFTRKLKEQLTALQIERRYTKREIIEMYLNTVEFGANAYGIQAASKTFFNKNAADLDLLEGATLVGMLQRITWFNPVRNPNNAKQRRNVVLGQMVRHGYLTQAEFEAVKDRPVVTDYQSSEIVNSIAPYFAMHVQDWLKKWGRQAGHDIYAEGLVVYTTLDSRMQTHAQQAVQKEMEGLQAVVDYEWSRQSGWSLGQSVEPYLRAKEQGGYEPFGYFWQSQTALVNEYVAATPRFKALREQGVSEREARQRLLADESFVDSLKARKTRLEAGLVALDPRSGHVKVWVGGRDLKMDWYDHVANAKRQPGSTFKPFVYTVAIDNGFSPSYGMDAGPFTWRGDGVCAGQSWSPSNMGGGGGVKTLARALATSDNYVTARLVTQVNPRNVALYAKRMGIESDLIPNNVRGECYMALALGTSDVTLLELTAAYTTLANGGIYNPPTVVTRIEDRHGNVLYEAEPAPREALSENTAYTVVNMMRGAIDYGTAIRLKGMYGLGSYDLAAKTGTTQGNADGWFVMMHPELVVGSWVGFNDRRIAFRSTFWGQGAHNAMYLVGDFFRRLTRSSDTEIDLQARFPEAGYIPLDEAMPATDVEEAEPERPREQGRVGW